MHVTIWNGQATPVGGMYADDHGHVLFLRRGDLAPICPRRGPATVSWRLVREIPDVR